MDGRDKTDSLFVDQYSHLTIQIDMLTKAMDKLKWPHGGYKEKRGALIHPVDVKIFHCISKPKDKWSKFLPIAGSG